MSNFPPYKKVCLYNKCNGAYTVTATAGPASQNPFNFINKDKNMSTDTQIITGLKLSEAIKLLEENEGALIRPDDGTTSFFAPSHMFNLRLNCTYSVKLPPPKSVIVTRADVEDAYARARRLYFSTQSELMDAFYKELGL